jgi:hypothetical protein
VSSSFFVMPRGGARSNSGPSPTWKTGKTRTIRVPIALADQLLEIARQLDSGTVQGDFESDTGSNIELAVQILNDALALRANSGGAIKARIREALPFLSSSAINPVKVVR